MDQMTHTKWKIRPKTEEPYTNKPSFAEVQIPL